jgi:hypothetical protein
MEDEQWMMDGRWTSVGDVVGGWGRSTWGEIMGAFVSLANGHRRLLWQQAVLDSAAAIAEPSELRKLSIFEKIKNPKSSLSDFPNSNIRFPLINPPNRILVSHRANSTAKSILSSRFLRRGTFLARIR